MSESEKDLIIGGESLLENIKKCLNWNVHFFRCQSQLFEETVLSDTCQKYAEVNFYYPRGTFADHHYYADGFWNFDDKRM